MSLTAGDHTAGDPAAGGHTEGDQAAGGHPGLTARLAELTQELLDAHCDTVCLARQLDPGPEWAAHVDYLKGLQRVGQRTLAELSAAV
jgi:hypothetical protein